MKFFFFFLFFLLSFSVFGKESFSFSKINRIRITFPNKTVTTRTIDFLEEETTFLYKIVCKKNFPYLTEQMEKKLDSIFSADFLLYEKRIQKQLESYGFFESSEKIEQNGVLLESLEFYSSDSMLRQLKQIDGIQIEKL